MKEKYGLGKKLNIIRTIFVTALCLSMILQPYDSVLGNEIEYHTYYIVGEGDKTYDFQELLSIYRFNSVTYRRNMLEYRIQALDGKLAYENHASIESQYLDVINTIEELKNTRKALYEYKDELASQNGQAVTGSATTVDTRLTKDTEEIQDLMEEIDNQIANIDLQLIQYEGTKRTLDTNLSKSNLTKNISDFYVKYQDVLENEARKKLENDFLKQCYSLIIYQEEQDYNKAYQDYLDVINEVDKIRYRFGIVTETQLDANDANSLHNKNLIRGNQKTYENIIENLGRAIANGNEEFSIKLHINQEKKEYKIDLTSQRFISNNSSYQQIQNQIKSYQEYSNSGSVGTYTAYQQNELQVKYYKLQKEELENNIKEYVNNAINSYEKAYQSWEVSWKDLQVKNSQYNASTIKFQYKRASKLEILESLYEKEAAELSYYQSSYEVLVWQNILDNYIYGASP